MRCSSDEKIDHEFLPYLKVILKRKDGSLAIAHVRPGSTQVFEKCKLDSFTPCTLHSKVKIHKLKNISGNNTSKATKFAHTRQ